MNVKLKGEELILDPLKCVYWPTEKALLLSDIHIGKASHFRKNGIAIHNDVNRNNLWNLSVLVDKYKPEKVLVLGDLSHSRSNEEWSQFTDFLEMIPNTNWILISGNHDRLDEKLYEEAGINRVDFLDLGPFFLVHDRSEVTNDESYILSGHIHPAVRMRGKGRQALRLDCFYFGKNFGVLPAFGTFTGRHVIQADAGDEVYAIAGTEVIQLSPSSESR